MRTDSLVALELPSPTTVAEVIRLAEACEDERQDPMKLVGEQIKGRFPRLRPIWADGAYEAAVGWAKPLGNWALELAKPAGQKGFVLLKRRRVVERTFAWLMLSRRLARDYERLTESSEAMVQVSAFHLMLKRL